MKDSVLKKKLSKIGITVGTSLMSLAILAGFTSCNEDIDKMLSETETTIAQTTTVENTYKDTTQQPEEITPPEETTAKPQETTRPEETTTPGETTTTPPIGTTTPPEETTTPPIETTTPDTPVETPKNDLPADEDGYEYPDYFAKLVYSTINRNKLFGSPEIAEYKDTLRGQMPEIVFVERIDSTKEEGNPIVIYSRYCMNEENQEYVYTRMSFMIDSYDYRMLGFPQLYGSYAEYIVAVQDALQNKAEVINADLSQLRQEQDDVNDSLGVNYAKFLGEEFVDATVNCARFGRNEDNQLIKIVDGFAYDETGNAYSYVLKYEYAKGVYDVDYMLQLINQGRITRDDFKMVDVKYSPVAGVFQEQTNEAQ